MNLPVQKPITPDIFSYGFDKNLYRGIGDVRQLAEEPAANNLVGPGITPMTPDRLGSGVYSGVFQVAEGDIRNATFVTGVSGWQILANGDVEFNSGIFRGSLEAGSIHIPDQTTANSFHTETDGDSWWGCNVANWGADNNNAKAYILKNGQAKFQDIVLSQSVTLSDLQAGSEIAIQGWQNTCVFSASDYRTVAWSSGNIVLLDGTVYNISAGNTGNIAAFTYIYLDIAISTTVLQTTTAAASAVGSGRILIGIAENNADTTSKATFQVFGGKGGNNLSVDNIAADVSSTNEFISNTAQIKDAIISNAKVINLNVDKLVTGTMTSKAITLAVNIGGGDAKMQAGKTYFGDTARGFILGIDDVHATLGDATSQWDVTNPAGTTFRYTWDGTGTDPSVDDNVEVNDMMQIAGFNAGNNGNFTVTAVATNYFEVTNASGVVESNITSVTIEAGGRVKFEIGEGTITGGIMQTGISGSGERIKIYEDTIMGFDASNVMRLASDDGKWIFWDADGVACGGVYGVATAGMFVASFGILSLIANDGASVVNIKGELEPDTDGMYDMGSRLYKWDYGYIDKGLRFDYAQANFISKIDDTDTTYMRIRFDASSGNIGFGRTIYPIANDTYDLGVTSTHRWDNAYLVGNVYFETVASKGFVWDAAGDNAQFYYNNTDNRFVVNKTLNLNTNKIIGVVDPTSNQEAATKKYVDDNIPAAGANTALSNLASVAVNTALLPAGAGGVSLGSSTNYWNTLRLGNSIYFYGTANKGMVWDPAGDNAQLYYDNSNNRFVASKKLNMNAQKIENMATPTVNSDAATKLYVDNSAGFSCSDLGSCNMTSLGTYNHNSLQNRGIHDHHNAYSNGYAITPFSVVSSSACNLAGITCNGNIQPNASNTRYCGTSGAYWARVYSDAYFTKNATFQMFDKYDDLQILRDLKFGKKNELLIEDLPEEIQEEGFINFGGMTSFNLCASKKIVECADDLKKTIDTLTTRLDTTEQRLEEIENLLAI